MKKVKLTESQLTTLVNYITEADFEFVDGPSKEVPDNKKKIKPDPNTTKDQLSKDSGFELLDEPKDALSKDSGFELLDEPKKTPTTKHPEIKDDGDKESNSEDKKEKRQKFIEDHQKQFKSLLDKVKVCDRIMLILGDTDEEGTWLEDTISAIKFIVVDTENDIKAKVIYNEKHEDQLKIHSNCYFNDQSFFINGENAIMRIGVVNGEDEKTGEENINVITLEDFLRFDIEDSKGNCVDGENIEVPTPESVKSNIKTELEDTHKSWLKDRDKLLKTQFYELGFLGMNNVFFFPKGYLAMDDILNKYGLTAKGNNKLSFEIISSNIDDKNIRIQKGQTHSGDLIDDKVIKSGNITFHSLTSITDETTYNVEVVRNVKGLNKDLGSAEIEIIQLPE